MSKEKIIITEISVKLRDEVLTLSLGAESPWGRVEKIAYQGDRHTIVGSSYKECYTVEYVNRTVRTVIPHHAVLFIQTDVALMNETPKENGIPIPDLPGGNHEG